MIEFEEEYCSEGKVKIVGVGGAGGSVVDSIGKHDESVDIIAINTDLKALKKLALKRKMHVGASLTNGLGTGGDPELAKKAFQKEKERIGEILKGYDFIFIVAGLGGGTGTVFTPAIGQIASGLGAITLAVVSKPFGFEGEKKSSIAEQGHKELRGICDGVICVSNEELFDMLGQRKDLPDAFLGANHMLIDAVRAILCVLRSGGMVGLDFAEMKKLLRSAGDIAFGVGIGTGEDRCIRACEAAFSAGLIKNTDIRKAENVLVCISASRNLVPDEIDGLSRVVSEKAGRSVNKALGISIDANLRGKVKVTVLFTGLKSHIGRKTTMVSEESLSKLMGGREPFPGGLEDELDIPAFIRKGRKREGGTEDEV